MNYGVIIFRIELTAVTSFDFDYIRQRRLLMFFLPNGVLIRVNTVCRGKWHTQQSTWTVIVNPL